MDHILSTLLAISVLLISYIYFILLLTKYSGDKIIGEIGFIYVSLAVAYTIYPALGVISVINGDNEFQIALGMPSINDLIIHLWRQVAFVVASIFSYLFFRGKGKLYLVKFSENKIYSPRLVNIILFTILSFILILIVSSSSVSSYYENYTRFDDLPWFLRRIVAVIINLKYGFYAILLTILYKNYIKNKNKIIVSVLILCIFEVVNSHGSRIEALKILLMTVCLHVLFVKGINLTRSILVGGILLAIFSAIELVRSAIMNNATISDYISDQGIKPASELGAIFFTGIHLYDVRASGMLPYVDNLMLFYDFLSAIPFVDWSEYNPMVWYANNYYPNAVVPPFTMGPVAVSAMFGGELDLILRGIAIGAILAFLFRWFSCNVNSVYRCVVYIFSYSTVVMIIKYDIFWYIPQIVKLIIPSLILFYFLSRFKNIRM